MKTQEEIDLEKQIEELRQKQLALVVDREKKEKLAREDKQRKANLLIQSKLEEIQKLFTETEKIAEEAGVTFDFSLEYGMGGTFYPESAPNYDKQTGWISSSANC